MDNVTHLLAGLLIAESTWVAVARGRREGVPAGVRRTGAILGAVAAELPDLDIVYSTPMLGIGKLGYLLHHRGHTHTVLFAVLGALLLWGIVLALSRAARAPAHRNALLAIALAGTGSHVLLDWTNSYGVHPFWPVSNRWHYGDAVFIVEPWLWVVAIPPLVLLLRSMLMRVVLGVLLAAVVALAWRVDMVGRDVALAVTAGAVLALVAAVALRTPTRRVVFALAGWLAVETTFATATWAARGHVRVAVGPTLEDAVMTPAPGNPLCVEALVVERDGETYRATALRVAPFPALRHVRACAAPDPIAFPGTRPSPRATSRTVRWGESWSAPLAELGDLASGDCEAYAALRFIRVPAWERTAGRVGVRITDLRYGRGGFAEVITSGDPARCPPSHLVPPWDPPRARLLAEPFVRRPGAVALGRPH